MKRIITTLAAIAALAACGSGASAALAFNGDLETGDLSQWDLVQNCGAGRATVYSATSQPTFPAPVQGTYALRLRATNHDYWKPPGVCSTTPSTPPATNDNDDPRRSQVGSDNVMQDGVAYYTGFYVYLPTTFTAQAGDGHGKWMVLQEDFGEPFSGSPWCICVGYVGGVQSLTMEEPDGTIRWSTPVVKGQWVHIVQRVYQSEDDETGSDPGWRRIWYNGSPQQVTGPTDITGVKAYGQTAKVNHSAYRFYNNVYYGELVGGMQNGNMDVYFDYARVANDLAGVGGP